MANCPRCGESLSKSIYKRNDKYKSCPQCSRREGIHAYYPCDSFGIRHHEDGEPFIQSWCSACRSGRQASPTFLCT